MYIPNSLYPMQSVHKFLFNQQGASKPKLTLPPLVVDSEPVIKSMSWLPWRSSTPPAFLEPQPLTTLDHQRDATRPRSHRLSFSSLSSISSEDSFEDDQSWTLTNGKMDRKDTHTEQQDEQHNNNNNNRLSLPSINTTFIAINSKNTSTTSVNTTLRQRQLPSMTKHSDNIRTVVNDYVTRVDSASNQNRRHSRIGSSLSLLHASSLVDGNNTQSPTLQSPSCSSGSDSSSPSSPVSSSLSTFWASPRTIQNEQQHDFVTKNAHIKRPRNAWIHFRCYFGQSLKAKDPTIRAEEISKRASEYWSRLTNKQKKPWHVMAEQEKLAHQEAFPDYRYRPKRALPKSLVLTYPSTTSVCDLDPCRKKFKLA